MRSKQTSEQCERTSDWRSKWPSTSVCILGCSGPLCSGPGDLETQGQASPIQRRDFVRACMCAAHACVHPSVRPSIPVVKRLEGFLATPDLNGLQPDLRPREPATSFFFLSFIVLPQLPSPKYLSICILPLFFTVIHFPEGLLVHQPLFTFVLFVQHHGFTSKSSYSFPALFLANSLGKVSQRWEIVRNCALYTFSQCPLTSRLRKEPQITDILIIQLVT